MGDDYRPCRRVYISADLEGASGVTRPEDVVGGGLDYQLARRWLTLDVNAAIAGARDAGATEFVVEENHGAELLCNLLLDEIDDDAEVVRGFPRPGPTTAAALTADCDAVFLVGHHAQAGSPTGFLSHTVSSAFADVRLAGRTVGEGHFFALMAAELDVPTALITGDDVVAMQMRTAVPGIQMAIVKTALSRTGGRLLPPARARSIIRAAAAHAVRQVSEGTATMPAPHPPYDVEVDLAPSFTDLVPTLASAVGPPRSGCTFAATTSTAAEAWAFTVALAAALMPHLLAHNLPSATIRDGSGEPYGSSGLARGG